MTTGSTKPRHNPRAAAGKTAGNSAAATRGPAAPSPEHEEALERARQNALEQIDGEDPDGEDPDEEEADIDLDAEESELRKVVGEPFIVALSVEEDDPKNPDGPKIRVKNRITIPHELEWTHLATILMSQGQYGMWANEVLSEKDYSTWAGARLSNYQIQAIFARMNARSGTDLGKSRKSGGSSRGTKRR